MGSLETLSRLETVSRQNFYCLGLEPHCLGLGLGLGTYCLGLVPRQDISRQLQLTIWSRLKIIPFGRQVIQSDTMNFSG